MLNKLSHNATLKTSSPKTGSTSGSLKAKTTPTKTTTTMGSLGNWTTATAMTTTTAVDHSWLSGGICGNWRPAMKTACFRWEALGCEASAAVAA